MGEIVESEQTDPEHALPNSGSSTLPLIEKDVGKYYSPRLKKLMTKIGETFDAAGKAFIGFAGLSSIHLTDHNVFFLDLSKLGGPQFGAVLVGLILIAIGIYWQTEAER